MDQLRTVSIANRLRLLIAIFALSFLAYGLWSYKTLLELKVGGPLFEQITEGHDLVSDVLPPPLYIIESYLVCLQLSVAVDGKQQGDTDRPTQRTAPRLPAAACAVGRNTTATRTSPNFIGRRP